ncbi:MAG: Gfo/Idh/MocA family oxidoreductase [Planctomycetota bacterium]
MNEQVNGEKTSGTRREFLKTSALVAAGTVLASSLPTLPRAYAGGTDTIKACLIGCGGRGSGAAEDALKGAATAGAGSVKFVAVADAFEGNAKGAAANLNKKGKELADIPPEKIFVGLDAYQKAIDSGVDMVVTAAAPGFRAQHFEAPIHAGKHIFMEKPVCTDAPTFRKVMAAAKMADEKKLKVGVGLQRHHESGYQGGIQAIADGKFGDISLVRVYWNGGGIWNRPRAAGMTEMQFQVHNWYHFCWASGDHICEQHVHNLDIGNWVMSAALKKTGAEWAHPVRAQGIGTCWHRGYGDFIRTMPGKNQGQIWDAHMIEYTFENGIKMLSQCKHHPGNVYGGVFEEFHSTTSPDGKPNLGGRAVSGAAPGPKMALGAYQQEHMDLQKAIRDDTPYNEAYYGAISSFTAVFGRMATYSGAELKWDEAVQKGPDLFPQTLAWDAEAPVMPDKDGNYPIPVPGVFKPWPDFGSGGKKKK